MSRADRIARVFVPSLLVLALGLGIGGALFLAAHSAQATPTTATITAQPQVVSCDSSGIVVTLDVNRWWSISLLTGETVYVAYDVDDPAEITLDGSAEANKLVLSSDIVLQIPPRTASRVCLAPATGTSTAQFTPGKRDLSSD